LAIFERFRLGNGTLKPRLRAELEAEGLVLVEEGLRGSIRYDRFKAPGKRFYGRVTGERLAIGISELRLVVYCRSGSVELIDSPFTLERLSALEPSLLEKDRLALRIDYDRMPEAAAGQVSGVITIRAWTPKAPLILEELRARLPPAAT
jgi:hypothetical protein